IDRGADIDARNKCGRTPLHLAIETAPNIACALINLGANLSIHDNRGESPLSLSTQHGDLKTLHLILARSSALDPAERVRLAPYIGNEWDNSRACAKLLVTSGAVIDIHDNELRTPLHYATRRGLSLARYLIEQGADVFARDSSGSMALDDIAGALLCAVRRGNIEIARYLIGRGASARGDRELPWAPICLAAIHGPLSMVRLLIDNGADIDHGQGIGNMAAIHAAAAVGYVSIVRLLVEHGARVNDVLDGRWTALHLAAMADHTIHVLLDAGADLNAETEEGWKPIDVALDRKIRRLLYQQ
ncbi:ankyrin repeat-containing domain protein, partial [Schizophyllum commune]